MEMISDELDTLKQNTQEKAQEMANEQNETVPLVNVNAYLSHDYVPIGNIVKLDNQTQFYAAGKLSSHHAIIICPDTLGWNSGRIRNIADYFGANDFFVVIPKLSGSIIETGETESVPSILEVSNIGDYIKGLTFNGNFKPRLVSILNYLHSLQISKIALLGFSWGGWIIANILASELAEYFVCGVIPHPSINLEERLYGGSMIELFSRIQRPLLLFLAKDDPKEYAHYISMLSYRCPTSDCITSYTHYDHGFILRGDLTSHPHRQQACHTLLTQCLLYIQYHMTEEAVNMPVQQPKKLFADSFKEEEEYSEPTNDEMGGGEVPMKGGVETVGVAGGIEGEEGVGEGGGEKQKKKAKRNPIQRVFQDIYHKTEDVLKQAGEKLKEAFTPATITSSGTVTTHPTAAANPSASTGTANVGEEYIVLPPSSTSSAAPSDATSIFHSSQSGEVVGPEGGSGSGGGMDVIDEEEGGIPSTTATATVR